MNDDYVKRSDVHDEIARFIGYIDEDMICRIQTRLARIPAADVVERKKGKWALVEKRRKVSVYRCSECGNFFTVWPDTLNCGRGDMNYCPNCGADMRE